mgnify:CR=1 FL=1
MSVRLIAMTQPVYGAFTDPTHGGKITLSPEDLVAYCARVSNPANQGNFDTSAKLLKYLSKNQHWSPFEMVHIVMEINTTRDIARQILRHRSFSFQEFSQRYADASQLGFQTREVRLQDTKNRQNSIETSDQKIKDAWVLKQKQLIHEAKLAYKWALENGVAKEQARAVLPEGITMSRMYMAGSLRSWIHYCQLRMENGTQKEHREIATECWNIITTQFSSIKTLEE